jgi:CspA family cold shock protein
MQGITLYWNRLKGYGFIAPDDGSSDVFCHVSALLLEPPDRRLDKGQSVEFDLADRNGRRIALNVRPVAVAVNEH